MKNFLRNTSLPYSTILTIIVVSFALAGIFTYFSSQADPGRYKLQPFAQELVKNGDIVFNQSVGKWEWTTNGQRRIGAIDLESHRH